MLEVIELDTFFNSGRYMRFELKISGSSLHFFLIDAVNSFTHFKFVETKPRENKIL